MLPSFLWLAGIAVSLAEVSDDIVVTASPHPSRALPPTVSLGYEQLLERQPVSSAQALDELGGVSVTLIPAAS